MKQYICNFILTALAAFLLLPATSLAQDEATPDSSYYSKMLSAPIVRIFSAKKGQSGLLQEKIAACFTR